MKIGGNPPIWVSHQKICPPTKLKKSVGTYTTLNIRKICKNCVDELLLTTTPPFKGASAITIARWTKETLTKAGVDTTLFKAHSVRGASTSKLSSLHIPVREIMKKAAWASESTFRKFYEKTLLPKDVSHQVLTAFINENK